MPRCLFSGSCDSTSVNAAGRPIVNGTTMFGNRTIPRTGKIGRVSGELAVEDSPSILASLDFSDGGSDVPSPALFAICVGVAELFSIGSKMLNYYWLGLLG